jgi:toxin YoeB
MGRLLFSDNAWEDYLYWQFHDKKTLQRINALIKDIARNDNRGMGKPEPLREDLSGYWSRRIDDKNRLVYRILDGGIIEIHTCRSHYGDK